MKCYNHENIDAVGICKNCGIAICKACCSFYSGKLVCLKCLAKIKNNNTATSKKPNIRQLIDNFDYYLSLSEKVIGLDTSWREGVAEHIKVIDMIRKTENYESLIKKDYFLKAVHNTLKKWGLNQRRAKIKKFDDFKENILKNTDSITSLKNFELEKLTDLNSIKNRAIFLFNNLNVMESRAKLVSVSKTLAHFLPDLIPPMDMENIFYFFYGYKSLSINTECTKFWELLEKFHFIQKETYLTLDNHKPEGFNTSVPKMIDNAIWGYNYEKKLQIKNSKGNIGNSDLQKENKIKIPVWKMIANVVKDSGKEFTFKNIIDTVEERYGSVNKNTLQRNIYLLTVNNPLRTHWSINQRERLANSQYDLFFKNEESKLEIYIPEKHGIWEIIKEGNKYRINLKNPASR